MLEGGCYCGSVRYTAGGEARMKAECLCRECQYVTGGGPNFFMMMPAAEFTVTRGELKSFTRTDIPNPVTRKFCGNCGTQIITQIPNFDHVVLKVGSLDDPAAYGEPSMVIFACDQQPFHVLDEKLPVFDKLAR